MCHQISIAYAIFHALEEFLFSDGKWKKVLNKIIKTLNETNYGKEIKLNIIRMQITSKWTQRRKSFFIGRGTEFFFITDDFCSRKQTVFVFLGQLLSIVWKIVLQNDFFLLLFVFCTHWRYN